MDKPQLTQEEVAIELQKCIDSPAYFYNNYFQIKDKDGNVIDKPKLTDKDLDIQYTTPRCIKESDLSKLDQGWLCPECYTLLAPSCNICICGRPFGITRN